MARVLPLAKTDTLPEELANEEMMFATNDAGLIVSFNKGFLELMKTTHKEMHGVEISRLVSVCSVCVCVCVCVCK